MGMEKIDELRAIDNLARELRNRKVERDYLLRQPSPFNVRAPLYDELPEEQKTPYRDVAKDIFDLRAEGII